MLSVTWASNVPPGGRAGNAQRSADSAGQHKGNIQLKRRSLHHVYVAAPASTTVRGVLHLVNLPALASAHILMLPIVPHLKCSYCDKAAPDAAGVRSRHLACQTIASSLRLA